MGRGLLERPWLLRPGRHLRRIDGPPLLPRLVPGRLRVRLPDDARGLRRHSRMCVRRLAVPFQCLQLHRSDRRHSRLPLLTDGKAVPTALASPVRRWSIESDIKRRTRSGASAKRLERHWHNGRPAGRVVAGRSTCRLAKPKPLLFTPARSISRGPCAPCLSPARPRATRRSARAPPLRRASSTSSGLRR